MDRDQPTSAFPPTTEAVATTEDLSLPPSRPAEAVSLGRHLRRGVVGAFAVKVGAVGLGYGVSVLLARVLGVEAYGTYAYALMWVGVLALPGTGGLDKLIVRETARARTKENWPLLRGLLSWTTRTILLFSIATVVVAAVVAWLIAGRHVSTPLTTFLVALAAVPLTALSLQRQASLRGLHHPVAAQTPEALIKPLVLAAALAGLYGLTQARLSPVVAMGLTVLAAATALTVGTTLLAARLPVEISKVDPAPTPGPWLRAAAPMMAIGGMHLLNVRADIIMLGAIRDLRSAGLYRAAGQIAQFAAFAVMSVNVVLAPVIADLHARGAKARLQKIITRSAQAVLGVSAAITAAIILGRHLCLGAFGDAFLPAQTALVILCLGQFVNAATGSVAFLLTMTGHERDAAGAMAVGAGLNLVLNAALIPRWGMEGGAMATAVSMAVMNLIMVQRVWRRVGIHSTALGSCGLGRRNHA